jgi:signal transduction histidine kinase
MIRPLTVLLVFGLCLSVVLAALAWTSFRLLRFDAAQREAQSQAALEENVRLALWRMDSALAALVAQESVRPAVEYQSVYYLGRNGISLTPLRDARPVSSPLATTAVPFTIAHLQMDDDGRLTSPRSSDNDADPRPQQIHALAKVVAESRLVDRLPPPATSLVDASTLQAVAEPPAAEQSQQVRGTNEFRMRSQYVLNNSIVTQNAGQLESVDIASSGLAAGVMTPLWLNGRLLLARRVRLSGHAYLQICWLDWPAIEEWLTGLIGDLLPAAHLAAAPTNSDEQLTRRLAALPFVLIPGETSTAISDGWSPLHWTLAVAWICVLLAAAAVGALSIGVVSLSERRAAFVSAVTHELRTPLTTLRMYAEMLADGMVPSDTARQRYLEMLRSEAERLARLVENVLAFARLERGRSVGARETVRVGELLDRMDERLAARCRQAHMQLVVKAGDDIRGRTLRTDPSSIEQIVFNLVDNACKYASSATDRRILLSAAAAGGRIQLGVTDHGAGLSPQVARGLFRPFSKSAEEAARSAAGVGLGLALCRRLSRQLGGTLKLDRNSTEGACFMLSLPIAD